MSEKDQNLNALKKGDLTMSEKNQNVKTPKLEEMSTSEKIQLLKELNREIERKGEYIAQVEANIEAFMIANNIKEMTLPDGLTVSLKQ